MSRKPENHCYKCLYGEPGQCYVFLRENDGLSSISPQMRKKAAKTLKMLYSAVDKKRGGKLTTRVLSTTNILCNGDIRLFTNSEGSVQNVLKDYYTIDKAVAILLKGVPK